MKDETIEERVKSIITPVAEEMGVKVFRIEWKREKKGNFLRIFIDKEGGVNVKDCAKFSQMISPLLDKVALINERYYLEVSSPGLDRELIIPQELKKMTNRKVRLTLKKTLEGTRVIVGRIKICQQESIVLENRKENKTWQISIDNIAKAKLEPEI